MFIVVLVRCPLYLRGGFSLVEELASPSEALGMRRVTKHVGRLPFGSHSVHFAQRSAASIKQGNALTSSIDRLPPISQMLLQEDVTFFEDDAHVKRFIRDRRADFRAQAEWTAANYKYPTDSAETTAGRFVAFPSAGLDLFSGEGACQNFVCRVGYVEPFARTLGLYADTIYLSDPFSHVFVKDRLTAEERRSFAGDMATLKILRPLIEADVIRFRPKQGGYCPECFDKMIGRATKIADKLRVDYADKIAVTRDESSVTVTIKDLYEQEIAVVTHRTWKRAVLPSDDEAIVKALLDDILNALTTSASAARQSGVTVSNSRVGLTALLTAEGRRPKVGKHQQWESLRAATLPWVENLSVQQIVQLREEAQGALPRLREKLSNALRPVTLDDKTHPHERLDDCIAELRADAAEVASELDTVKATGGRRFANMIGTLGLTISGYGLFSDSLSAAATLAPLVTLLGLVHQAGKHQSEGKVSLRTRPGYVLLQAQDILKHAGQR